MFNRAFQLLFFSTASTVVQIELQDFLSKHVYKDSTDQANNELKNSPQNRKKEETPEDTNAVSAASTHTPAYR